MEFHFTTPADRVACPRAGARRPEWRRESPATPSVLVRSPESVRPAWAQKRLEAAGSYRVALALKSGDVAPQLQQYEPAPVWARDERGEQRLRESLESTAVTPGMPPRPHCIFPVKVEP